VKKKPTCHGWINPTDVVTLGGAGGMRGEGVDALSQMRIRVR
jgi:hypothetical protein